MKNQMFWIRVPETGISEPDKILQIHMEITSIVTENT